MTLEDHLGDIIRKARTAAGVSKFSAAQAAGITVEEESELEEFGRPLKPIDLKALAALLRLHPAKLERIAGGWMPLPTDLGLWRELRVISTTRDGNTVNCFLIWDEVTREAALFDTGWEAAPVLELVESSQLQLKHLFLTHTHEDHIAVMADLRERHPKLHLHTNSKAAPPHHRNRANDCLHLGSLRITNRETPGHAEDGVIYLVGNWPEDAPHVALVGDTIFAGSLATGFQSWAVLKEKVRSQILSLPEETLLCPGHGPLTTVEQERACNPFFE
jgi:glyoxylase-like metal-dependent hydrolase (beta-lactamase superfamily II)